jgi:four helix bundle protein
MAPAIRDYRDLRVWELAHQIAVEAYSVTKQFPRDEMFGMTSQIRRSASSVPANLAEGCGRGGNELARFSRIALGSAMELDYHLLLARDVGLLAPDSYERLAPVIVQLRQMLGRFIKALAEDPD